MPRATRSRKKIRTWRVLAKLRGYNLDYVCYVLDGKRIKRYIHPDAKSVIIPREAREAYYGWDDGKVGTHWGPWGPFTESWRRSISMFRGRPDNADIIIRIVRKHKPK